MRARIFAPIMALLAACGSGAALGADCNPLTMLTSVKFEHFGNDPRIYIPVSLQGKDKYMLVDTGGYVSEITPEVSDALGLNRRLLSFGEVDVAGKTSNEAADVMSFSVGQLTTKSIEFVIAPENNLLGSDSRVAGVIGPNILKLYDVDIDFGTSKFALLSQDHCEGKVIYWPASAVAVVPFQLSKAWHIVMTVQLDGKNVTAMLDTGAASATLTIPAAESDFDLKMGSADTPYVRDMSWKPGAATYRHRFQSLDFDGVAIGNLEVAILPDFLKDKYQKTPEIGTRIGDPINNVEFPDMLIGMNVLKHLHIYIAYNEKKLYITPASSPPANSDGGASSAER